MKIFKTKEPSVQGIWKASESNKLGFRVFEKVQRTVGFHNGTGKGAIKIRAPVLWFVLQPQLRVELVWSLLRVASESQNWFFDFWEPPMKGINVPYLPIWLVNCIHILYNRVISWSSCSVSSQFCLFIVVAQFKSFVSVLPLLICLCDEVFVWSSSYTHKHWAWWKWCWIIFCNANLTCVWGQTWWRQT